MRAFEKETKKYNFSNNGFKHYIITYIELNSDEIYNLEKLLVSFPHANNTEHWPELFLKLNIQEIPEKIRILASNAYDQFGNSVLGIAAEYGKSVLAVQKLIDMGADINARDENMNKLPLHWAINNKLSYYDKNSFKAVEVVYCLLKNGARTDITCYDKKTPLEYAKSRGFTAAAKLIQEYGLKEIRKNARILAQGKRTQGCLFQCLSDEILVKIAAKSNDMLDQETAEDIAYYYLSKP